jgi:hypothetical protein
MKLPSLIAVALFIMLLLLAGCSTVVPVTVSFPEKPSNSGACPALATVTDEVKLSELTTAVAKNYSAYHECAVKVDTWNEWYERQKKIFESVK